MRRVFAAWSHRIAGDQVLDTSFLLGAIHRNNPRNSVRYVFNGSPHNTASSAIRSTETTLFELA